MLPRPRRWIGKPAGATPGRLIIRLVAVRPASWRAVLRVGETSLPCAIGRAGVVVAKREGDGATPAGGFALRWLLYRPDRMTRPRGGLAARALRTTDGWCDDPTSRQYNHLISLPFPRSHERMWRDDNLYDLVVGLGYNDRPVRPGRGSAIFLHVAAPRLAPTAGCVALRAADLIRILPRLAAGAMLVVQTALAQPAAVSDAGGGARKSRYRPAPRWHRRRSPSRSRGSCPSTAR